MPRRNTLIVALGALCALIFGVILFLKMSTDGDESSPTESGQEAPPTVKADPTRPVTLLEEDAPFERMSPLLKETRTWPGDEEIQPADRADSPPSEDAIQTLVDAVRPLVASDLFPDDPKEKVGVDPKGRLLLRLGNPDEGIYGQATLDASDEIPTVALRWTWAEPEEMTFDTLLSRLKSVSSDDLARELLSEKTTRRAHPEMQDPDGFQATLLLDSSGFGMRYTSCVLYGTKESLVGVYTERREIRDPKDRKR